MHDFDAIVIGSGHNALGTALYLAKAGWRVAVLERAADIGGGLKTAECTRPGFHHDLYATNVGAFLNARVYKDFGSAFARYGLEFLRSDLPFATAFDDDACRISCAPEATAAEIARLSSTDAEGWTQLAHLFDRMRGNVGALQTSAMPSVALFRHLAACAAKPDVARNLLALAFGSCRSLADRYLTDPKVKALLFPWAFHSDFAPDTPGGGMFALFAALSPFRQGLFIPSGGAAAIANAMGRTLVEHGGTLFTNMAAQRIEIVDNVARGVRCANGTTLSAKRAIVAGVAPAALLSGLLPEGALSPRHRRRLARFTPGLGTFVVHLALSGPLQWRAGSDLARFFYVHLNGQADEITRTQTQAEAGLLPDKPMIAVSQPTALDTSRAPTGCGVVRLHVRCVPANIKGDASDEIQATDWRDATLPFAERMLSLLAAAAPNLRDVLLDWSAMSPDDIAADNPNMIGGDCSGGSHRLAQHYVLRPALGWSRHTTPIHNLYLTGASTWPGSGIHCASGYLAAQRILSSRPS
jgi:phytoene dehydrogenase-like protein